MKNGQMACERGGLNAVSQCYNKEGEGGEEIIDNMCHLSQGHSI